MCSSSAHVHAQQCQVCAQYLPKLSHCIKAWILLESYLRKKKHARTNPFDIRFIGNKLTSYPIDLWTYSTREQKWKQLPIPKFIYTYNVSQSGPGWCLGFYTHILDWEALLMTEARTVYGRAGVLNVAGAVPCKCVPLSLLFLRHRHSIMFEFNSCDHD